METEVAVEGNEEGKFKEAGVAKSYSSLSSTKQLSDPIVYKLVRVEGDGRLVPATDDEVMEVESLLLDEKSKMHIVADTGQAVGCISNDQSSSGMLLQLDASEGLLQTENAEVDPDKFSARLEENVPSSASSLSKSHVHRSGSFGDCSNPSAKLTEAGSLISATATTSIPDFSKLKGEICLDNLSIKELHETFKATFGRDTTVKDKQWLKRRITMGLTNSCDVSATTFIIKDNKLVKKGKEGFDNVNSAFANDPALGTMDANEEGSPINYGSQLEDHQVVSLKRSLSIGENSGSEDHNIEQRAAKRVRKPTRRYIEELSEVESKESSGRIRTSLKNPGLGQMSSNSHGRLVRNVSSDGRTMITRLDSLGGSGIHIPCVSRVRRSRPRKNFMALLKFNPSSMGMTAKLVKKALGARSFLTDDENGEKVIKASSAPSQVLHQCIGVQGKDRPVPTMEAVELEHSKVLKPVDSSGDSDDNVVTVPTSKGGIRRKHHRAWTLSEVMKLVEGVSRYGAGRWSEIKRLAFASYSYRTSVDLKDKWRNLLKASFAQIPSDRGINSRKTAGTMPIPEPILLRVRELAEMQSQVPPNISSSKVAGNTGSSVHEKQSGFL
ncbi:uncharacterized protein LOC8284664 isoform X2 [Ricinus communis]|uniref:uncharacterized protein LOC8284664 isoform X2 n=1 Tax=Ricinus communis TaxID=3988 RepID=UPI00077221C2|nr:uncharacterized protein LOC8284664 isoform X2 [Ricinus communis]|eukprot:XP_015576128.1 uncharacterized protein LOC8284664 isoform X2 [Ricinus communis]